MILFLVSLTIVNIPYELKSEFQRVEFFYSKDGKEWYPIGVNKCPYLSSEIKDTFRWVVKGRAKGDIKIKVVYSSPKRRIEKELKDVRVEIKESKGPDYIYNGGISKAQDSDTTYSWRMLGYDAQHTGYYPHPLYPPLELKWEYGRGLDGSADYRMVSSSAGNSMLYTRKGSQGSHGINWVAALNIETGEEVWSRELTSNVWTTALSHGDSLLFVGTSSGWDTLSPTFYCMDPFTGEIKWSKFFHTVEFSPIVVDTVVYAPDLQGNLYAYTFSGNTLWSIRIIGPPPGDLVSPAYLNNRVYIGGENSALLSLNAYTGETLWVYPTENWIWHAPVIYDSLIFISVGGWPRKVFAVSANSGELRWQSDTTGDCVAACNGKVYTGVSYWTAGDSLVGGRTYSYNANDGSSVWNIDLFGGRTSDPNRIISGDGTLWWMPQWIVGINAENGRVRFISDSLPDSTLDNLCYTFFFPIFYERYVLRGYRRKIYLYEASESPPDNLNTNSLISIPNPFSSSVQIIGKTEENTLFIYDLLGRKIKDIEGTLGSYGYMYFIWDGRDERGEFCPNGVYLMKVGDLKGKTIYIKRR